MTDTDALSLESLEAVETFFAHMGIELQDEITQQAVSDANAILAHFGVEDLEVVPIGPDGLPIEGPIVEQYGVKGMKWGVRRSKRTGKVKARSTIPRGYRKVVARATGLQGQTSKFQRAYNRTYRASAKKIRQGIKTINNDPIYKGVSFKRDTPLRRQYYDRISSMASAQLNAASIRKGKLGRDLELVFHMDVANQPVPSVGIRQRDTYGGRQDTKRGAVAERQALLHDDILAHAVPELTGTVKVDDLGHILDFEFPELSEEDAQLAEEEAADDVLQQYGMSIYETYSADAMAVGEAILEQYGVKGMKWGVRRRRAVSSTGSQSTGPKSGPTKPARPVKKSAKSMTDQELNAVINRMRLESQYNQLTASKSDKAKQFIQETLLNAGKSTVQTYANQYLNAAVGAALNKAKIPSATSITQAAQKAAEEARKATQKATEEAKKAAN